jgi:CRISPR/Cas system-associated exonuclease Cas4 (RecB family)
MATCKSCFGQIDGRSVKTCSECDGTLHKDCVITFGGVHLCDVCFTVAEEKSNSSQLGEFELPDQIRRTHIETYRSCPHKFYLEVIKGNKMPQNEYTQVGSDVHEVIEAELHEGIGLSQAKVRIENYFAKYDDALFENKTKTDMFLRATESIDTFYEAILPHIKNIYAIEEQIVFSIGEDIPNVSITMDLITEYDGELDMHDWKTGKVMVGKKLEADLQAPLYIYAVQKHFNKPVKTFTFYYLQENKTRTFVRSETNPDEYICMVGKRKYVVSLMDAIREVKRIFNRIKKGNFNIPQDTRSMYFTCKMCHLQKEGLCQGADEQSWHNAR